jgi:hypothetical protein
MSVWKKASDCPTCRGTGMVPNPAYSRGGDRTAESIASRSAQARSDIGPRGLALRFRDYLPCENSRHREFEPIDELVGTVIRALARAQEQRLEPGCFEATEEGLQVTHGLVGELRSAMACLNWALDRASCLAEITQAEQGALRTCEESSLDGITNSVESSGDRPMHEGRMTVHGGRMGVDF